jgi:hypothetical protein
VIANGDHIVRSRSNVALIKRRKWKKIVQKQIAKASSRSVVEDDFPKLARRAPMAASGGQKWIDLEIDEGEWEDSHQATQRGRLIGRETFQKQVEAMTGRRLVGEARGRPKKAIAIASEKVL